MCLYILHSRILLRIIVTLLQSLIIDKAKIYNTKCSTVARTQIFLRPLLIHQRTHYISIIKTGQGADM